LVEARATVAAPAVARVTTSVPSANGGFRISVCVLSLAPVVTVTGEMVVPLETHTVAA
jgi:hypothetical protein